MLISLVVLKISTKTEKHILGFCPVRGASLEKSFLSGRLHHNRNNLSKFQVNRPARLACAMFNQSVSQDIAFYIYR